MDVSRRLKRALELLLPARELLEQRIDQPLVPPSVEQRGWAPFLLSLDEGTLRSCEADGIAPVLSQSAHAPATLVELAREVDAAAQLPRLHATTKALTGEALRSVGLRKRAQLSALLSAVAPMAKHATRIVDVGAGSGHLTRLSADLFGRDTVGLEHNPARVAAAERRSLGSGAAFVTVDARSALDLVASDLAMGLHACGELGDHLAGAAAAAGSDLALISCCLQKISAPVRAPLSALAAGSHWRREHLGLTNLTAQSRGIESALETTLAARQTRYALGELLRARSVAIEAGAEMSGINRRQANRGLEIVAERALALRGLPPATRSELEHHARKAAHDYAIMRRLSLPRSMLARLVEVSVSLDRAQHLCELGSTALVATLFERHISPRNIGIFASRDPARLPAFRD